MYLAEVSRFLLEPAPGHEGLARSVFSNVQHVVPYHAFAAISKPADAKWMRWHRNAAGGGRLRVHLRVLPGENENARVSVNHRIARIKIARR